MTLHDISATLEYVDPPIRRVLRVRDDVTLFHLHCALQVAFDWSDLGLYYFEVGPREFGPPESTAFAEDTGEHTVGEVIAGEEERTWSYGYFPAEEALWDVELVVEPADAELDDGGGAAIRCVEGSGASPLEELDGPFAHMDARDADPGGASRSGNGAGPNGAGAFDPEPVNERLRLLESRGWEAVFGPPEEEPPDDEGD